MNIWVYGAEVPLVPPFPSLPPSSPTSPTHRVDADAQYVEKTKGHTPQEEEAEQHGEDALEDTDNGRRERRVVGGAQEERIVEQAALWIHVFFGGGGGGFQGIRKQEGFSKLLHTWSFAAGMRRVLHARRGEERQQGPPAVSCRIPPEPQPTAAGMQESCRHINI